MKRLDTINHISKHNVIDYEIPKYESGDYVVDDSCFIPMSEAIKQLSSNGGSSASDTLLYDFKDGKDNGMSVPATRTKQIKDIAEISTHISEQTEIMSEKIKESKAHYKKVQDFENALASAAKSSSSGASSSEK